MDGALLPVEVCERIVDFCNVCTDFLYPQHLDTLRACALTCEAWLPRSRLNLYSSVRIRNVWQLEVFLRTIATRSFLADFVGELVVGRSTAVPDNPAEKYLPFAQDVLLHALRYVRSLKVCHFEWRAHHPRYHELVARYPIVELDLVGGSYHTMGDLFRVVWAFEHLQVLRLVHIATPQKPGMPLTGIIQRRPNICSNLKTAMIVGHSLFMSKDFPPLGCFGNSLTWLTLTWADELGTTPSDTLLLYLSAANTLQYLTWWVDCGPRWARAAPLADCTLYISRALRAIPADAALRTVALDYRAPLSTGPVSRTAFLARALGGGLRPALRRFAHLAGFILRVPEPAWARFGAGWWMRQVALQWRANDLEVDVQAAPADTEWAEEEVILEGGSLTDVEYYWEDGQMRLLSKLGASPAS